MNKKRAYLIVALLLVGVMGILYITRLSKTPKLQSANDTFFGLFKSRCEVFRESPYHDPTFAFSITFANDQLVCLLKDETGQNHEVYLWQKDIFDSESINVPFQDAILGKVSANPSPETKGVDVIDTFSTMIDDEAKDGEIIMSKNCGSEECTRAKRVIFERDGTTFSIEEYNGRLDLFENIHFDPKALN